MKYDLVFEGGGAKGMVLVGAYEEFVRRGHSHRRLLGTSAGAITAALAAAGYTPDEMLAALDERENGLPIFAGFLGQPAPFEQEEIRASAIRTFLRNIDFRFIPGFVEERLDDAIAQILAQNLGSRHLFAFVERGGWYAADRFVTWLGTRLDSGPWHGGQRQFSQMTLSQFFDATQVDLSLVASDTTDARLLVLNHNTAPQCPLVWAVRMSMSIPLLWDEVIWQKDWGTCLGRDHAFSHLVVRLPAQGYGTTEFDMSDERRAALVEAGRSAMGDYFDNPPEEGSRDLEDTETARAIHTADRIAMRLLDQ